MRSVLVVLALAGLAAADPIRLDVIRDRTRSMDPAVRADAAAQLAKLRTSSFAMSFVQSAVISDDPVVRAPLIDALVSQNVLPRVGAIHIPGPKVLERMLHRLYPKLGAKDLPAITSCSIASGTERSATVLCTISRCESVMHVTIAFEITTGVRWTAAEPRRKAVMDGSCGDIM